MSQKIDQIVWMNPSDLIPYDKNAKLHPQDQVEHIANSIKMFGWTQPIVVDENNVVVIGHGRLMAAKSLMLDKVPVVCRDDLTEEQINACRLADNKTNESPWDFGKMEEELAQLAIDGIDMGQFGFDELSVMGGANSEIVEDEAPAVEETAIAKRGQIYQLGDHRVMCGDATSIDDIEKLMNGAKADIAITSPPYGEGKSAKLRDHYVRGAEKRKSLYNEHKDNADDWRDLIEKAIASMRFASQAQFINIQMLADNKRELVNTIWNHNDQLCDVIIWDKQKAPPQMQDNILNNEYEFVFVLGEENASRSIPFADFHGNRNNIIRLKVGVNEYADIHRAVYPVEFPAEIMKIASKAESVLDVFGGTGTTLIACEQMGKTCYMIELDPRYVDVIIKRWENLTGKKAVLLNDPE